MHGRTCDGTGREACGTGRCRGVRGARGAPGTILIGIFSQPAAEASPVAPQPARKGIMRRQMLVLHPVLQQSVMVVPRRAQHQVSEKQTGGSCIPQKAMDNKGRVISLLRGFSSMLIIEDSTCHQPLAASCIDPLAKLPQQACQNRTGWQYCCLQSSQRPSKVLAVTAVPPPWRQTFLGQSSVSDSCLAPESLNPARLRAREHYPQRLWLCLIKWLIEA